MGAYVLFADAALVGQDAFSVRSYLPLGGVPMLQCPRWVSTLQAAELCGSVEGVRLATYMKWPTVCVGSDSTVAQCQIQGHRGSVVLLLSATYTAGPVLDSPPNLPTGTAHTYTVHKTNTDACSFTGGRLVCRGSMIHFSMIVSMVFLKCA